jgi:hypothetical protein
MTILHHHRRKVIAAAQALTHKYSTTKRKAGLKKRRIMRLF